MEVDDDQPDQGTAEDKEEVSQLVELVFNTSVQHNRSMSMQGHPGLLFPSSFSFPLPEILFVITLFLIRGRGGYSRGGNFFFKYLLPTKMPQYLEEKVDTYLC